MSDNDFLQEGFENLINEKCAFIDVSTLKQLEQASDLLSTPIDNEGLYRYIQHQAHFPLYQGTFETLARMVAFEFLVVDGVATDNVHLTKNTPLTELIRKTYIPDHVYGSASQIVTDGLWRYVDDRDAWTNKWFDGADKGYHDILYEVFSGTIDSLLADSNQSVPRVVFYLELSRHAGIPVFLSPSKKYYVEEYNETLLPEVLQSYKAQTKRDALAEVQEVLDQELFHLASELNALTDFSLPPLDEFILRTAFENKTTLLDSVGIVRNMKGAKNFRNWLFQLQQHLMAYDRPNAREAINALSELRKYAQQWAESGDPNRKMTTILPLFSVAAGVFGMSGELGTIKIKDRYLWRPLYIQFVSNWYD